MPPKTFQYNNNRITFELNGDITITTPDETFTASTQGKEIFTNASGESVIELSGLSSEDKRADRSWAIAFYEKEGCAQLHYHNYGTEDYYVTKGVAKVSVDGSDYILSPGETIWIAPEQQHRVVSIGEENLEMIVRCTPAWTFADQHFVAPEQTLTMSIASPAHS